MIYLGRASVQTAPTSPTTPVPARFSVAGAAETRPVKAMMVATVVAENCMFKIGWKFAES